MKDLDLDISRLESVLDDFGHKLPEMPKWIGLVTHTGEFVCGIGQIESYDGQQPSRQIVGKEVQNITEHTYQFLDVMKLGNLQASIHMGGDGVMFMLNLSVRLLLCVSYHGSGEGCCCENIDQTETAIRDFSIMLMQAIYNSI